MVFWQYFVSCDNRKAHIGRDISRAKTTKKWSVFCVFFLRKKTQPLNFQKIAQNHNALETKKTGKTHFTKPMLTTPKNRFFAFFCHFLVSHYSWFWQKNHKKWTFLSHASIGNLIRYFNDKSCVIMKQMPKTPMLACDKKAHFLWFFR